MDSSSGGAAATVTSMAPSCTVTSRSAKTSVSSSSGAASDWSNSTAGCGRGGKPHKGGDPRWKAVLTARARDGPLGMGDFRLLRRLGCGDIGTVYLSELSNGAGAGARAAPWFAMKVMDKASLESRRKLSRAQTELEILQLLDHPFLGYRIARVSSSSAAAGGFFQQDELLPPECLDRLAVAVYRRAGKVPVDCVFCLSRIDEGEEVRELGHGAR